MSKASILRQLNDADLEEIHHRIRRDADGDLEIAKEAERRGQTTDGGRQTPACKFSLGPTDAAKAMVIARYRQGAEYRRWLNAWENRDTDLRKAIETQKQRFTFISELVHNTDKTGLEAVSNGLMARLLTLATEMPDEALMDAAAGQHGWVAKVIRVVQEQGKAERRNTGEKALAVSQDKKLSSEERQKRLKEIFGIP